MSDELAVREIDVELVPARINVDRAAVEAKVQGLLEPYIGITEEAVDAMDEKEAKACRADLNRISKDLNDARKEIKKAFSEPLVEFEAWVKEMDALIAAPCKVIADSLDRRDKAARRHRLDALNDAYADFCECNGVMTIYEQVPIERIIDPKWLNKSFGDKKAENLLIDKVSSIINQHRTLCTAQLKCPEQTRARFWECLNFAEAMEYDSAQYERQRSAESIQQNIQQNLDYQGAQSEEYVYQPYEPAEVPADYTPMEAVPPQEKPSLFRLTLRSNIVDIKVTPSEWERVKRFLQEQGIHGTVKEYQADE